MEKGIVFDMDGVLFDTERVCNIVWMDISREIGFSEGEAALKSCVGLNRRDEAAYFAAHHPEVDFEWFIDQLSCRMQRWLDENGMPIKTGTRALLTWLRENMWKVGLATSTRRVSVMHHLERTELTAMFDTIVTGDRVEKGKPNPEIYLTACRELGLDPAETYAVEDSRNGLRAAHDAGMKAILVPDLIEPTEEMLGLAYRVEESLLDVMAYLKKAEK
ncbi:MAG: HAD family phosphatase [Ruminococcus sp.]|nr:HAD family phosphatase [Ruminococcus sp.]